jgi:hypothetical protein
MRKSIATGALFLGAFMLLPLSSKASAQQVYMKQECKPYEQRGVPGAGGMPLRGSNGKPLMVCRTCRITVKRFWPDKKECPPWPLLPNG